MNISYLLRKNIRALIPYSSARDEYKGHEAVFLDANENPFNSPLNRYPDPHQQELKKKISGLKGVPAENIFLGNGSDEAIDLLIRAFCEPGENNILSIKPTYGMYKVSAGINNIEFRESLLTDEFQINVKSLLQLKDEKSKMIFLCSPNNPTSNSLRREDILYIIRNFDGIVIIDEAYIDFSIGRSLLPEMPDNPNMVILQTFSKAWGLAGIRLGMAFAHEDIISVLDKIKYPYNINALTQKVAMEQISTREQKDSWVRKILSERDSLAARLASLTIVKNIMPSDANFLMVRFDNAREVFEHLRREMIIVRDRSGVTLCEGYLRITIGSEDENDALLDALKLFTSKLNNGIK